MDSRKYMLLVNGQDKTDSVASFRFQNGMCEVIYANSPKSYRYHAEKVQLLKVQNRIDPSQVIITVDGNPLSQVDMILDFGPFYRFLRTGKKALTYPKGQVELQKNCLKNQEQAGVFEYFIDKEMMLGKCYVYASTDGGRRWMQEETPWLDGLGELLTVEAAAWDRAGNLYMDNTFQPHASYFMATFSVMTSSTFVESWSAGRV